MTPLHFILIGGIIGLVVALLLGGQHGNDVYIPIPIYPSEPRGGCGGVMIVVVIVLLALALMGSPA